jgi:hypothetical protein
LARANVEAVDPTLLARWRSAILQPRETGVTVQIK